MYSLYGYKDTKKLNTLNDLSRKMVIALSDYRLKSLNSVSDLLEMMVNSQKWLLPHGESLQSFCVKHKVPYHIFQKWYKVNITWFRAQKVPFQKGMS